jgi:hypothetical protein
VFVAATAHSILRKARSIGKSVTGRRRGHGSGNAPLRNRCFG